jgi:hypothetical protein
LEVIFISPWLSPKNPSTPQLNATDPLTITNLAIKILTTEPLAI